MLTGALLAAAVFGVAKVVRDVVLLRQLRAAMAECSPEDRARICLRMAGALGGFGGREAPPAETGP
ncbi:hypothetical protein OHS33_25885 [Streptomyces sp. NBC_00536]|uniref:hypothetical protein n=1 Tax=Streptomyces sp. NBC_00536 TaxID=2975769 RepID=UPI002E80CAB7|nr:hypothetical protein [Streptomyces sp. NBC_00536]WUC81465.1 hypothetical protein OHS33_25885 [Streptomyces sp. NBC_00536]